jgi:hypothetical protein
LKIKNTSPSHQQPSTRQTRSLRGWSYLSLACVASLKFAIAFSSKASI